MSKLVALAREHTFIAICFAMELLALLVVVVLAAATDGALFEGVESTGYQALAWMVILIVLMNAIPVFAVIHERRRKRPASSSPASSAAPPSPSGSR